MKTKFNLLFIVLLSLNLSVFGRTDPKGFNYKTVIYNSGVPVSSSAVTLRFTYYDGMTTVYQETFTKTTSSTGIVTLNMGEGTEVSGHFDDIDFSHQISYKVEVDLGSGYTEMGTHKFKFVPYAKHALTASSASSLSNALSIDDLSDAKADTSSVFIGKDAGNVDDGSDNKNVGIGIGALAANTTGCYNVAIGKDALSANVTGYGNTAIGRHAGKSSTGDLNVFIGYRSGYFETGNNKLYIDNTSTSTPLIYGDFDTNQLTVNGKLRIKDGTEAAGSVFTSDANGIGYWKAQKDTMMLPAILFQPKEGGKSYFRSSIHFNFTTEGANIAYLPITLPVGTVVTSITVFFYDNHASNNLSYYIYKSNPITDVYTSLGSFESSGDTDSVQNHTFDTDFTIEHGHVYYIYLTSSWSTNASIYASSVKIVYTHK